MTKTIPKSNDPAQTVHGPSFPSDKEVLSPDFADYPIAVFAAIKPFLEYLQPLVGAPFVRPGLPPKKKANRE